MFYHPVQKEKKISMTGLQFLKQFPVACELQKYKDLLEEHVGACLPPITMVGTLW